MASIISPNHAIFLAPNRKSPSGRKAQDLPIPQQQVQQHQQQQPTEQELFDENYQVVFCKAMYDYAAQDASALSFRRGDIIEVLNQQPSGWWDGLLGDERGWFPSNYVTMISLEEAELAFSGSDYSNGDGMVHSDSDNGVLDMSSAMMRGQAQNEEWLDSEMSYADKYLDSASRPTARGSQTNDFWEPNIMDDGRVCVLSVFNSENYVDSVQIFYVNSRTGEHSWDLPQETADEISESELAGLSAQSTVRAATGAGMVFGAAANTNGINGTHAGPPAGFGIPRTTGTPEPWIKRLADDGTAYYYINKQTGETMWTRPEPAINGSHSELGEPAPPATRSRRTGSRSSVYSDDSDVHPDHPRHSRSVPSDRSRQLPTQIVQSGIAPGGVQLTSEEVIAKQLQQVLAPPAPELVTDLATKARDAIQAIMDNVQGNINRAGDDQRMDDLIQVAVRAVRNLLYISAANSSHMPTDLLAKETRDKSSSSSPLKPAQRRVTATLSRLVLSARAMHYDSGSHISETLSRIEADALELERAVGSFIAEVQRCQRDDRDGKPLKRLYGTFTTAHIGAGLVGAGSAGTWKGFGWVSQEVEERAPKKPLGQEVIVEIAAMLGKIEEAQALASSHDNSGESLPFLLHSAFLRCLVEQLRQRVQDMVTYVSHFLRFIADVHIARHVDIDGIRQAGDVVDDMYAQTLSRARTLVRTLETAVQAVYDDSSSLLLTTQVIPSSDPSCIPEDRSASLSLLESVASSLRLNLALVRETLEGLLAVGHEQADLSQGDYNGSIEWRMSRLSMVHNQFGGAGGASRKISSRIDLDQEDVVDLADVFNRPVPPPKPSRLPLEPSVDLSRPLPPTSERTTDSTEGSYTGEGSTLVPEPAEENELNETDTIDEDREFSQLPKLFQTDCDL
jgi:son of sevenless-like protein